MSSSFILLQVLLGLPLYWPQLTTGHLVAFLVGLLLAVGAYPPWADMRVRGGRWPT